MKKKWMSLLLTGCIAASMLPAAAFAADVETPETSASEQVQSTETSASEQVQSTEAGATVVDHGSCGDNLNWILYSDGALNVIGTGEIGDLYGSEHWKPYKSQIKTVVLSDGVTGIGAYAFDGCKNMTSVTIGSGVKSIGYRAFSYCSSLTSLTIPKNVASIGIGAFDELTSLNTLNFNALNCKDLGTVYTNFGNAGKNASSLVMNVGSGVTRIPGGLLWDSYVTKVNMTNSVQEIGRDAFYSCTKLTSITLNNGLKTIAASAFAGCTGLTSMNIPASVTSIGGNAFHCANLKTVQYNAVNCADASEDNWGRYPFAGAGSNTTSMKLTVGSGVWRIPGYMFYSEDDNMGSYVKFTSVSLPISLREIGAYAFGNCKGLTEITVPESVIQIGANAFDNCNKLSKIYFRGDAPKTGDKMFNGLLSTAYYPTNGTVWSSVIKSQYGGIITWNSWTPQNVADIKSVSDIFTDVPTTAWYRSAVQYVYDTGLMVGDGNTFKPSSKLTRAMVAQILYSKAGSPAVSSKQTFSDVKPSAWYFKAVQWASANGIASGVGDGKFNPSGNITREQLSKMLYNDCGKPSVSGNLRKYSDYSSVSSWAYTEMVWVTQAGIISGYVEGNKTYLKPKGYATRAEAASMLMRYTMKY